MEDLQAIKQRFEIIGNHSGLHRAIDIAKQVAPTDLSVLQGKAASEKRFSLGSSMPLVLGSMLHTLQSTAELFLREPLTPNYSAMRKELSLELFLIGRDILK